jgi:hypothetical protein
MAGGTKSHSMISYLDEPGEDQIQALRRMTPEQRLEAAASLYRFARQVKLAGLRQQFPTLSEIELKRRLNEAFLYASD